MDKIIDIKNNILIFNNKKIELIIDIYNVLWFNAKEVCVALGYKSSIDAIKDNVEKENKTKLELINKKKKIKRHPHTLYINESGLYSLLFNCRFTICKEFRKWITEDVIPSIRKYGYYEIQKKYKQKLKKTNKELEKLKKQYEEIEHNLKKNNYPKGGLFYVIETNKNNILKIGISNNMNKRCNTYNTLFVNNVDVLFYKQIACPIEVELCVKSLLHKYRYRNKREFYTCDIEKIKNAFFKCVKVIKENNNENNCKSICNNQNGGSFSYLIYNIYNILKSKIQMYEHIIKSIN